jgi:hypothetical protein
MPAIAKDHAIRSVPMPASGGHRPLPRGLIAVAAALLIAESACVSLWVSSVLVTAPIQQAARRRGAGLFLLLLLVLIEAVGVTIVGRKLFLISGGHRTVLQFVCLTAGYGIASIACGLLMNVLAPQFWEHVARFLFAF